MPIYKNPKISYEEIVIRNIDNSILEANITIDGEKIHVMNHMDGNDEHGPRLKFTKHKNSVIPIKRVNNDKGGIVNQKLAKFSPGVSTKDKNKMLRIAAGVVEFMAETIIDYFKDPDRYAGALHDGENIYNQLSSTEVKKLTSSGISKMEGSLYK